MTATTEQKRRQARERKRRQRERERSGLEVYLLEIGEDVADALAERGLLHPSVADQRESVERALRRFLAQSLGLED